MGAPIRFPFAEPSPGAVGRAELSADARRRAPGWRVRLGEHLQLMGADGADATPRSRKARALIAYLSLAPGREASREALIDVLWSDRGREQGRASMRQCLSELRIAAPGLIATEGERVWLAPLVRLERATNGEARVGSFRCAELEGLDPSFDRWLIRERAESGTVEAIGGAGHPAGLAQVPPRPKVAANAPSSWGLGTVALALAAATVAVWLWPRSAAPATPVAAVLPFEAIGPGAGAFATLATDGVRAAAPPGRVVVRALEAANDRFAAARTLGADYVATGGARPTAHGAALRIRVEDARTRALLWSDEVVADGTPETLRATLEERVGGELACAFGGSPGPRRDVDAMSALMTACAASLGGDPPHASIASYGGDADAAVLAFRAYNRRVPGDAYGHALLATAIADSLPTVPDPERAGARREAEREARAALAIDPKSGAAWGALGQVAEDRRDFLAAEARFRRGLRLDPRSPDLYSDLAGFLLGVGRLNESVAAGGRALALKPTSTALRANLAELMADDDQPREARAAMDALVAIHPGDMDLRATRFSMTLRNGDASGARDLLAQDEKQVPIEPEVDTWARALIAATGKPDSSEAEALEARWSAQLRAAPDSPVLASQLEMGLAQSGRIQRAIDVAAAHTIPAWILFRPINGPMTRAARFPEVAARQGLLGYWRRSDHWPDVCWHPGRAWACA
ncbi:MAG: hypothetical protein ACR2F8_01065 [Caulobacteraceae bacterium]